MFLGSKLTVSGYLGPSLVNYYPLSITKLLYVFQDISLKIIFTSRTYSLFTCSVSTFLMPKLVRNVQDFLRRMLIIGVNLSKNFSFDGLRQLLLTQFSKKKFSQKMSRNSSATLFQKHFRSTTCLFFLSCMKKLFSL